MLSPRQSIALDGASNNLVELLLRNKTVLIEVSPGDHLLQLLLRNVFAQLLSHSAQVFDRNEAGPLIIVEGEHLCDVSPTILVTHLLGHQGQPLLEIDRTVAISIEVRDHLEDSSILSLETQ